MEKRWIKNGNFWDGISIVIGDMRIWNPSEEQLIEAGYTEYVAPTPPEPTAEELLESAKQQKISEINQYDSSDNVNEFSIIIPDANGGDPIEITNWFTPELRADYRMSIDAAIKLNMETVSPVVNGIEITIPTSLADVALAQIQIYANQCFNVTSRHKAAVQVLSTIQEVEAFDITADYPQKLQFTVPNVEVEENEEEPSQVENNGEESPIENPGESNEE